MNPIKDRWYSIQDGFYLQRCSDGGVRLVKTEGPNPDDANIVDIILQVDAGTWGSMVLTMSEFSERPGDWHQWMDHHFGRRDLLV